MKRARSAPWITLGLSLAWSLAAAGCQTSYVLRQGWRQLTFRSREIAIADQDLAARVGADAAGKLAWVPRILAFARQELGLEPGDSYTTFVDTGGRPTSYAVTAAHPRALIPFQWHFPFAGRVPYKGFFDAEAACREAERLQSLGFETIVFPVQAYSTLGWFQDPVVSSMLAGSVADLVDVVLHETTHRTVYFPGSTSFNESLATFVAREGTIRFLEAHDELRPLLPDYLADQAAAVEREELLLRLRDDLDALYRSPLSHERMERRKREIFELASNALHRLGAGVEQGSIKSSNAYVLAIARYHELEKPLAQAQARLGGHPRRLVSHLAQLRDSEDPVARIFELAQAPLPLPIP